jgi:hypothetical protein
MRTTLKALAVLSLVTLFATSASAGIPEELTAVRDAANGLLTGGTLEKAATKATEKVIAAVDKAEAFADDEVKYVKKAAAVLKKTDAAQKKGADLTVSAGGLLQALIDDSASKREDAVQAQNSLFIDKDKIKVGKTITKGDAKETKAVQKETNGSKGKLYAAASKLFVKARNDGVKLREKEIDKGLVVLEIVSTSLDASPSLVIGEFIEVEFNLPMDPGAIGGSSISVAAVGSEEQVPTQAEPPFVPDENRINIFVAPDQLVPGQSYVLTIHGLDSDAGEVLESREGIPLKETFTIQFTAVMPQ